MREEKFAAALRALGFNSANTVKILLLTVTTFVLLSSDSKCGDENQKEKKFALIREGRSVATFIVTRQQNKASGAADRGEPSSIGCCGATRGFSISNSIKEFNEDLRECSGIELPVSEQDDGKASVIRFALETRILPDEDRFSITFPDDGTMLITGSAFSIRWALNHILENFAGVRYLTRTKNGTHFPQITDLSVPVSEIQISPDFNLGRMMTDADSYLLRRAYLKNGIIGGHELSTVAFPVKKYMAENKWPEFIFPVKDGKKFLPFLPYENPVFKKPESYCADWQPCMSNKETINEAVKNICEYFERHPEILCVSLGVNDRGAFCECGECRRLKTEKRGVSGHVNCSELYYSWLNKIVASVTEKYPDKYFSCLAYREVISPPSFNLHKNIVPLICFESHSCMDAEVKAAKIGLLKEWNSKASQLAWWEYGIGGAVYGMPRVCFSLQREMMKTAHGNGVRGMQVESYGAIEDGPKKYLYRKLMWDVNANLDALLRDWYEACAGKEAAPYLAEYFQIWDKIWSDEGIKTDWFKNSKKNTYLSLCDDSYFYAVGRDDMPKMRELMEKVVSLSERHGDKRQRIRAKWIMREFECAEASVYALGAHIFPSSGTVENAGQALEYINFLPEAVKYDLKRLSLHEDREKNDFDLIWGFSWHFKGFCTPKTISAAAAFCSDPEVRKAFEAAAKNPGIPAQTKGLLDILMKTQNNQPVENLLRDGSFENNNLDGWNWQITSEKAFLGQKSLTSPVRNTSLQLIKGKEFPIKPGSYLLSAMVFVEKDNPDVEEHVRMSVYYGNKGVNQGGAEAPRVCVKPGEWRRLSMIFDIPNKELDYFDFGISFYNYSGGDLAYADDIIITPLNLNQR